MSEKGTIDNSEKRKVWKRTIINSEELKGIIPKMKIWKKVEYGKMIQTKDNFGKDIYEK